jgi:hypothetical protein
LEHELQRGAVHIRIGAYLKNDIDEDANRQLFFESRKLKSDGVDWYL